MTACAARPSVASCDPFSLSSSAVPVEISGGPFPPDRQDALAAVLARAHGIEPEEAALLAVVTPCVVGDVEDEQRLVEDLWAADFEARHVERQAASRPPVFATPSDADVMPVASRSRSHVGIWLALGALAVVGAGLVGVGVGIGSQRAEPPPAPATDIVPGASAASEAEPFDEPEPIREPPGPVPGTWTTAPVALAAETAGTAALRAIRTGRHDGFDRVVFEFAGDRMPAVRIVTAGVNRSVMLCRSDIPLEGDTSGTLLVSFGQAADATGGNGAAPLLPALTEYWQACGGVQSDYPDALVYGVERAGPRPYRTQVLRDRLRLVLDVQSDA